MSLNGAKETPLAKKDLKMKDPRKMEKNPSLEGMGKVEGSGGKTL